MLKIAEVSGLTKMFGKKLVLNDIAFDVFENDLIGLVGLNGSGKTTLFKCLTGLLNCDGKIDIFGKSLKERQAIFEEMLYIFDKEIYISEMTGYEIIRDFARFYGKFSKAELLHVLSEVGLDGSENLNIKKYSLGMKQRINIAKIMIAKPKLVLMDEPFNGIDIDGVEDLVKLIKEYSKENHTAFIVSSHQISELEKFSNRIIAISNNKIVVDKYFDEQEKAYIGIDFIMESDVDIVKAKYNCKFLQNKIYYFETSINREGEFIKFLADNGIIYSYFNSNNAIKQEVFELLGEVQ